MGSVPMNRNDSTAVEAILGDELARADRALRGVAPVISHMLVASGEALVNDAILARLRGMLAHLASSLLGAGLSNAQRGALDDRAIDALCEELALDQALLEHLYAMAVEGLLAERLESRLALDPVLSPLLQELIASDQPATAELAMRALAAQSRFMQSQARMELALGELPPEIFAGVLMQFERFSPEPAAPDQRRAIDHIRKTYDEGASRLGLLARLVSGMRRGARAGLVLEHAGVALFTSCLAEMSGQSRDLAVLSCHERQNARLALALRAAGSEGEAIESQLQVFGPVSSHADTIAAMPPERARAILAQSGLDQAFAVGAA